MSDSPFEDFLDAPQTRTGPRFTRSTPMFPEGLITPLLLVLMVTLAGLCVQESSWSRIQIPVGLVAAFAVIAGSVLAKLRVPDAMAHLLAVLMGVGLPVVLVERVSALGGGFQANLREVGSAGVDWYLGEVIDESMESLLVSMIMGCILWLVGYLAGWALFRRGWMLPALVLPGFLILVNLGYADDPDTRYLLAYAGLALILVARQFWFQQTQQWSRARLTSPVNVKSGAMTAGLVLALVATLVGAVAPASLSQATFQPLMEDVSQRMLSAQDRATAWLQGGQDPLSSKEVTAAGSYASFDDAFSVGGPLNLTDDPQVLVAADQAPYLAAQSFDTYTGRGWRSTTEETFDSEGPDGRRYSPQMTFAANQNVPLTDEVMASRLPNTVDITPLTPTGGRLYTVDTYQSSSIQASVQMSWVQLDEMTFDLEESGRSGVPTDLLGFASLLQGATLTGEDGGHGPTADSAEVQETITREWEQLQRRFLTVSWTADASGAVEVLTVSGQLPIYDDVEAVFARRQGDAEGTYRILTSTSTADGDDLSGAGEAYPDWVMNRYLSLPDTITPRTHELAQEITASADNPYDMARAIEAYIRAEMIYDENVEMPPEGVDIVDYLLFENPRGYCEYSASAMTVMLRTLGVPARVVVGFYPGDYDEAQGGFLYLQSNAHAWTEVFFPGYGWIPFEPTPSQPLIEPGAAQPAGDDLSNMEPTPDAQEITPEATMAAETEATPLPVEDETPIAPQVTSIASDGDRGFPWMWVGVVGGVALLSGVVALLWFLPLRGVPAASAMFMRLRRIGTWLGVRPPPSSTPREYGRAFVKQVPQTRGQVERIVRTYEVDQYGPAGADSQWVRGAEEAWGLVRRQLVRLPFRVRRPGWFRKGG